MKEIKTLEDLEKAFNSVAKNQKDKWADSFWNLYSHGYKILYQNKLSYVLDNDSPKKIGDYYSIDDAIKLAMTTIYPIFEYKRK